MDKYWPRTPEEMAKVKHLYLDALPFPMRHEVDSHRFSFFTMPALLPLFPGMALDELHLDDPFHTANAPHTIRADDITYNTISALAHWSKGWKELNFYCDTDSFLQDWHLGYNVDEDGTRHELVRKRNPQPETWNKILQERDRDSSGARVELWIQRPGKDSHWTKVEGNYNAGPLLGLENQAEQDYDDRPAVEVRMRRGKGIKYKQDGIACLHGPSGQDLRWLYDRFEEAPWPVIKKELFIRGAERDPTIYL